MRAIDRALRGVGRAVGSRPWLFISVALGVFALDILVPPLVLSIARQPVTSFTVNPHRQIFKCFGCGLGGDGGQAP